MPNAAEVRPGAWSEIIVLYDNGWYSAIWGRFRGQSHKDLEYNLGVRWNGDQDEVGYPNARRYPQWYVEPHILHEAILLGFQKNLIAEEESHTNRLYLNNIEIALSEAR